MRLIRFFGLIACMSLMYAVIDAKAQQTVYSTHFENGIDSNLMVQAPRSDSIQAVPMQQVPAIRVTINKGDDFSRVANGAPRGEISFNGACRFNRGTEYLIRWSTFIPNDFEFDPQQPEGIAQIHEGARAGSPPFGLMLNGNSYTVRVQGKPGNTSIGDAGNDKDRWVQWSLRYKPDDTGTGAVTELYKDNKIVYNANGSANAWPGDDGGYFKIGVYKWWWQSRPSSVSVRTMYFGDVRIAAR